MAYNRQFGKNICTELGKKASNGFGRENNLLGIKNNRALYFQINYPNDQPSHSLRMSRKGETERDIILLEIGKYNGGKILGSHKVIFYEVDEGNFFHYYPNVETEEDSVGMVLTNSYGGNKLFNHFIDEGFEGCLDSRLIPLIEESNNALTLGDLIQAGDYKLKEDDVKVDDMDIERYLVKTAFERLLNDKDKSNLFHIVNDSTEYRDIVDMIIMNNSGKSFGDIRFRPIILG